MTGIYKKVWEVFEEKRKVAIEHYDYLSPLNEEQALVDSLKEVLGPEEKLK